jgi:hypothetical protein
LNETGYFSVDPLIVLLFVGSVGVFSLVFHVAGPAGPTPGTSHWRIPYVISSVREMPTSTSSLLPLALFDDWMALGCCSLTDFSARAIEPCAPAQTADANYDMPCHASNRHPKDPSAPVANRPAHHPDVCSTGHVNKGLQDGESCGYIARVHTLSLKGTRRIASSVHDLYRQGVLPCVASNRARQSLEYQ